MSLYPSLSLPSYWALPLNSRINRACLLAVFTKPQATTPFATSRLAQISEAMTELENCMESLLKVFHRYANKDGDGNTLSKKELKGLIEAEFPTFLKNQKNPNTLDHLMKDLDQNKDDKIDFEEFMSFISGLSVGCHKCFMLQQTGKKK
ncbi:protein S100-A10b [Mastacembelus armatus]|uniref:Protein S100 n=1 Tax=Mastacembelus armatus TaxID=205130 RepID=A0A3Q3MK14_9TELE|nr:protein S100-A1-like [Mastacembelus armatus]